MNASSNLEATIKRSHKMLVIFDLDGTLSLTGHRDHFLNRPAGDKDWRAFYAACDKDWPCVPIVRTAQTLAATGSDVRIWTGRSDEVADKTTAWLAANGLGDIPIKMRRAGDFTPDTKLKEDWLQELSRKPDLVFEDRARVVEMWRSHGIRVCQVAEGGF